MLNELEQLGYSLIYSGPYWTPQYSKHVVFLKSSVNEKGSSRVVYGYGNDEDDACTDALKVIKK